MAKQHFVMLAHPYSAKKHAVGGWFVSEKLDGQRCIYIPGTRGLSKMCVPFANTDKDGRYLDEQICSGLWSRYGNVIHAPDEWLDTLPEVIMDGELFLRRGKGGRQELSKIIKPLTPDADAWANVKFQVFDLPAPETIFADRHVKLTNYDKVFEDVLEWWLSLEVDLDYRTKPGLPFRSINHLIEKHVTGYARAHKQIQLPFSTESANLTLDEMMEVISDLDGEGLILRHPDKTYVTERAHQLLKVKALDDDEGIVTGYTTGRETDKGSRLLGKMGALILDYNGKRFELSGFTDLERHLGLVEFTRDYYPSEESAIEWAESNPGQDVPDWIEAPEFPRGAVVTFRYRDLTADGLPNEGRYWRHRETE